MSKWEICHNCNGEGAHSKHLGSFTSSDLADWSDDEMSDYFAGAYDCLCSVCEGTGKVRADQNRVETYYATDEEYYRRRPEGY